MQQIFTVSIEAAGTRLDSWLASQSGLSRTYIQKLISQGAVTSEHGTPEPKKKIISGESYSIKLPEPEKSAALPEDIPLDILYQDSDLVVLNKPRGIAVHPGAGRAHGTIVNALLYKISDLSAIGGEERPGIVHRLDMDTSGVMVIAKNDRSHQLLAKQFADREVKKEYFALVHGVMPASKGRVDAPIGRDPASRIKMAVSLRGRVAVTTWQLLEQYDKFAFLKLQIHTGRTHQIRVHLAYISHPIVGDPLYCNRNNPFGAKVQLLHAGSLSFTHPTTSERMSFTAPLPEDMQAAIRFLKENL